MKIKTLEKGKYAKELVLDTAKNVLEQRQKKGLETYGTTLDDANLSVLEVVRNLKEELADGLMYIVNLEQKLLKENDK